MSSKFKSNQKFNQQLLLLPTGKIKWYQQKSTIYNDLKNFINENQKSATKKLNHQEIIKLRNETIEILNEQIKIYEKQQHQNQQLQLILKNGTIKDRLASLTLLIQDSVVYNINSLKQLIQLINSIQYKHNYMEIINIVRDLFLGDLLLPMNDKKLQTFELLLNQIQDKNFLLNKKSENNRRKFLIISFIENEIRQQYRLFIEKLFKLTFNNNQQQYVLKLKSIQTMYELFINNNEQEKYLLQSLVNKLGDQNKRLVNQVIKLLLNILKKYSEMNRIIINEIELLLLNNSNNSDNINKRIEYYCLLFLNQLIFTKNNDTANKVLNIYLKIFLNYINKGDINNRIMSLILCGINRTLPFTNSDLNIVDLYLNKFIKLFYLIDNLNNKIMILSLIFNLMNGELSDRYYQLLYGFLFKYFYHSDKNILNSTTTTTTLNKSLDKCNKLNLLLNLIYRSIKIDSNIQRVRAFVKRLLQLCLNSTTPFTIAILIIINSLMKNKQQFDTIDCTIDSIDIDNQNEIKSWNYIDIKNEKNFKQYRSKHYEFNCRNPLYVNTIHEPFYELLLLKKHYHPTIELYVGNLLRNQQFDYDGDPLVDFSLKNFLNRFSYKNPKNIDNNNNVFSRKTSTQSSIKNINSKEFLEQSIDQIPIDERFIYKYLKDNVKTQDKDQDDDTDDIESITSLEFNDLLDNYENYDDQDVEDIDYAKNLKKSKNKEFDADAEEDADFDEEDDDFSGIDDDEEDFDGIDSDGVGIDYEIDGDEDGINGEDSDGIDGIDDDIDDGTIFEQKNVKKEILKNRQRNIASFKGRKGFSPIMNDIFASAEQFDHLLQQNDDFSDIDDDIDDDGDERMNNKKRKIKTSQNGKRKNFKNIRN